MGKRVILKGREKEEQRKGECKIQRVRENTKNKRVYSRLTETYLSVS